MTIGIIKNVGSRKVNAFQFDNPELHEHYIAAANALFVDLRDSVKGERWAVKDADGYFVGGTGVKRSVSPYIARLLDNAKISYAQIEKAINDIIINNGQENYAAAKKVELVLDDMLANGYEVEGYRFEPDYDYLFKKEAIKNSTDYKMSEEEWNALMENVTSNVPEGVTAESSVGAKITQQSAKIVAGPVSESMAMEQKLNSLREERDSVLDFLDAPFLENPDADIRQAENRLVKLDAEIDKLVAEERRASVKTPLKTILENIGKYRRSDLESLAEQIGDGNWDGYEDLTRPELEDALREAITERMDEMSILEAQHPKNGLSVRPVDAVAAPPSPNTLPENSLGAKITQQLPEGTGAASNPYQTDRKTSKVHSNTLLNTDVLDEGRKSKPRQKRL